MRFSRRALKWAWIYLLFVTGAMRRARRYVADRGGLVVLTFHRVLPKSQEATTCSLEGMRTRAGTFEALNRYVRRYYSVLSLDQCARALEGRHQRACFVFTFDDGWVDNARFAAPIARRYGSPLSIFVCPSKAGERLPFWPERVAALTKILRVSAESRRRARGVVASWMEIDETAIPDLRSAATVEWLVEQLKVRRSGERDEIISALFGSADVKGAPTDIETDDSAMTWDEMRALRDAGVVFGSHTQSHQILTAVPLEEAWREITEAKEEIEKKLRGACAFFSYPNGDWSPEIRNLVARAGYTLAFTNRPGAWTRECDRLSIPRVNIWEGKIVGPLGSFSPIAFEYATFWKVYRAEKQRVALERGADDPRPWLRPMRREGALKARGTCPERRRGSGDRLSKQGSVSGAL